MREAASRQAPASWCPVTPSQVIMNARLLVAGLVDRVPGNSALFVATQAGRAWLAEHDKPALENAGKDGGR